MPLFSCTRLTSHECPLEHALHAASTQNKHSLQPVVAALSEPALSSACTALNAMDGEIYAEAGWSASRSLVNCVRNASTPFFNAHARSRFNAISIDGP
jgi:hypothetical protein